MGSPPQAEDAVLGHYSVVGASGLLQPLLSESSSLFVAVVEDNAAAVQSALTTEAARGMHNVLYWTSVEEQPSAAATEEPASSGQPRPSVSVKQRSLLMLAAYHAASSGNLGVLKLLLSTPGVDPRQQAADNVSALTMAKQAGGQHEAEVVALLEAAAAEAQSAQATKAQQGHGIRNSGDGASLFPGFMSGELSAGRSGRGSSSSEQGSTGPAGTRSISADVQHHLSLHQPEVEGDPFNSDGALPYSTSELTQPEYSTDDFRMFAFKVIRCSKRFAHDWRACPFAHPTENARRRDPRDFRYCAIACPDYKQGFCVRGDLCPYAHGVFEAWLHPSRYRTQLCKDGANCHRPICFFAHSLPELRTPTHTWTPGGDDVLAATAGDQTGTAQVRGDAGKGAGRGGAAAAGGRSQRGPSNDVQGIGKIDGQPLTSPPKVNSVAAAMFGFTAPRMSNAFARRHGLNPKDNAMLNLQKIALEAQSGQAADLGRMFHVNVTQPGPMTPMGMHPGTAAFSMGAAGEQPGLYGARGMGPAQQQLQQPASVRGKNAAYAHQAAMAPGSPIMLPQGYAYAAPSPMIQMQAAPSMSAHDPSALAALNHHLAALNLHPTPLGAAAAYQGMNGMNGMGSFPNMTA